MAVHDRRIHSGSSAGLSPQRRAPLYTPGAAPAAGYLLDPGAGPAGASAVPGFLVSLALVLRTLATGQGCLPRRCPWW